MEDLEGEEAEILGTEVMVVTVVTAMAIQRATLMAGRATATLLVQEGEGGDQSLRNAGPIHVYRLSIVRVLHS